MIQSEGLKCSLESMIEMKTKPDKKENVNYGIPWLGKEIGRNTCIIGFSSFKGCNGTSDPSEFDEKEIEQVDHQEGKNNCPGVDHVF
jgi:hypothetical protein